MSMCALYVWCECVSAWCVNGHVCRGCVWACVWACMSGMCVGVCMGMCVGDVCGHVYGHVWQCEGMKWVLLLYLYEPYFCKTVKQV